ncbi:hypothetical protein HanRHA438_Chr12g0554511 [Helianthus annuus]|nr:hypothetical protein HanRHA438_Chr12g0554511 [Helianthus annuus]
MVKTWWIRRWYFLYISVFTTLPNFRKTCHEKFGVLQTFLDLIQTSNNSQMHYIRYPRRDFILSTLLSSIQYLCHSYTCIRY